MPRFTLKSGSHIEGDRTYKKGEVVESQNDLAKMFPGKFELATGGGGENQEEEDATKLAGTTVKDTNQTEKALDPATPKVKSTMPGGRTAPPKTPAKAKQPGWTDED